MRVMRQAAQQMTNDDTLKILKNGKRGVLALAGMDGYPYTLPINYVYVDGKLYFHGAKEGHKIDAIKADNRVSFCVIGKEKIQEEKFSTQYQSVVVFGKMRIVEDEAEKLMAIRACTKGYAPSVPEEDREKEIRRGLEHVGILCLEPEYITGKQSRDHVM